MKFDNRKIALIGTGMVGMSYAYALLNQNACDELVLIDIDREKALGEAMDLNHGLAFSPSHMKIYAGDYSDCEDADIIAICAGVAQKQGESRLALLKKNTEVFHSIIKPITESGFNGIFLISTNPVDIMSLITAKLSGFNTSRVLGTGTVLDTARLRYLLGEHFNVDPKNMHAYVIGEHGDSEFVPWSQAMLATKPILKLCKETETCSLRDIEKIEDQVRTSAEKIIKAKKATYYGIGMAMLRITKAIFGDENSVLTVSTMLKGEYNESGIYAGIPCIVNRNGIKSTLPIPLTEEENKKFSDSCRKLYEAYKELDLGLK